MNSLSNEVSFHINQLNRVQVDFRLLQCLFYLFPAPFPLGSLLSFILHLFLHLYPIYRQLRVYADTCPLASSRILWGMVIRLKKSCSKVTFSLMRPGSQLQNIQCGGSSFPLYIFGFQSFLYVYGARPYYQSFLEGHFDHQDLYLICAQLIRGGIRPQTTSPFVSCSLSLEFEPFITIQSSSNYSCSRPRTKTQSYNHGPMTPHSPLKLRFFPFIRGGKFPLSEEVSFHINQLNRV